MRFIVVDEMSSNPEYTVNVEINEYDEAVYHSDFTGRSHTMNVDEFTTREEIAQWIRKIEKADYVY